MNIEEYRDYCIGKTGVTESFPFDEDILVFKVFDKMFALANTNGELRISLKCDPEKAIQLREKHPEIIPGYHLSKKHWNTLDMTKGLDNKLIEELIDHSYQLVFDSLPKKIREEAKNQLLK